MSHDPELAAFLEAHPGYPATGSLDGLRLREYSRLDANSQVYLDYTGGGLYAESQILQHHRLLSEGIFGNPHSSNPSSLASTELVERTRAFILQFFHADPAEYVAIFTANASGALKIVGESYPFAPDSRYLLTFDNHNSVNGIREFAHARRGTGDLHSHCPAGHARRRVAARTGMVALIQKWTGPFRLPGAVQFLGRTASTRLDRESPGARLGCAAGCGSFCPIQSPRPLLDPSRLCAGLLL